jgi:hypothetical protein
MMRYLAILAVSVVAVSMSGCAALMQYQTPLIERATKVTEEQASFDMGCDELSSRLLGDITYSGISVSDGDSHRTNDIAELSIGITGCGKRASYFIRCTNLGGWRCVPRLNTIQ